MARVIEINQIEELEQYQLCWRSLLQQTRETSLFQSFEWLRCYWKHFGDAQKLRVLVVHSEGLPIGILPLTVRRELTRIGSVRVLTYPLQDWGTFFGPVGPNPTATLHSGLRHLSATPRDWDLIDLRWTNREIDHGRTALAMQLAGFPQRERVWKTTNLVELTGTWSDYRRSRSSKFRRTVRGCESRAARHGKVTYHRFRPAGALEGEEDPRWDLYNECFELARRSWQGSSRTGTTLSHDQVNAFFRETHELATRLGAVDINQLRLDGQLIAYAYLYHLGGRLYGVRTGYDPAHSSVSPGTLLFARMLEDSFARGDQCVDLGTDLADYKRKWRTRTMASYQYTHYPLASPRSQILRLKHRLRASAVV